MSGTLYLAEFNEPGDFDCWGIFIDEGPIQRLIAVSDKCSFEAEPDGTTWSPRNIPYQPEGGGPYKYAFIREGRPIP
jgi:hypothetical protein